MPWINLDENIIVNLDRIVAVERSDDFNSIVHVDFGGKSKQFTKAIPLEVLRKIILARDENKSEKYLEQLARFQTHTVL